MRNILVETQHNAFIYPNSKAKLIISINTDASFSGWGASRDDKWISSQFLKMRVLCNSA